MCAACGHRTSVTAGTIFDRTRTPLTVWFTACWSLATAKDGISALSLQKALEIGSQQTAWAMLHRLRSVLVRPGRDRLPGTVEVDETYIGGDEPGLRGGRAKGKKVLTGIAVEVTEPKGIGRCRMALLADGSSASLHPFVTSHIEPGAKVITDAWMGYHGLAGLGYAHERRSQRAARARGDDPGELLPAVHRVASPGRLALSRSLCARFQSLMPGPGRAVLGGHRCTTWMPSQGGEGAAGRKATTGRAPTKSRTAVSECRSPQPKIEAARRVRPGCRRRTRTTTEKLSSSDRKRCCGVNDSRPIWTRSAGRARMFRIQSVSWPHPEQMTASCVCGPYAKIMATAE